MSNVAYLPIVGDRYGPLVRHLFVVGLDLTSLAMRAQVRLCGDTPGAPLVDLLTVTNGNAEGLRLVEVTTDGAGLPTSHVEIVINETTMEGLPYAGELGDAVQFAWDMQVTLAGRKRRLAKGEFEITGDGVTGADAAPANRPVGYGRARQPITSPWKAARLTFGEEQVTVNIVDADLVAPLVKRATDAAGSAADSRDEASLSAGAAQATARYFTTRAAGEAASVADQSFATDDGAGNVIYYRRISGGSTEIGRAVTPASLAATNGAGRIGYKARTVDSRLSDEVWVGDFGPGLDAGSDWTAAIRAAIASIDTSGGRAGRVHLPVGAFRITDTIDVPNRIKLVGAGCRATIINSEHSGTAIRLEDVDFGGVAHMRITTATDSPTAVALELYSNTLWTQWNNFEDLEIAAGYAYTRGQKGIWCHSRDISTTITYNDWRNIRVGGYHRPWVVDDYYEGNFHYHIHVNGYGIDADDPAILHWGAANHWECWFGKGGSAAPTLVGIAYAGQRTNNRFKVTADIGPGKAMKLISGTMPKGGKANTFEVTGTEDVTPVGDVIPYAPFERGTFQPGIAGSETAGVATYNDRYGTFTRVGDRCFFEVTVGWSQHTGSGNVHLTGLPMPAADSEPQGMAAVLASGLTFARQAVLLIPTSATAGILLSQGAGFESVALSSPALLRVSGSYRVVI